MLQLYYRWRYRRAQRAAALKLPTEQSHDSSSRNHFGSYLSQQTVRGKIGSPIDQFKYRKRWFLRILVICALLAIGWVVYESLQAIQAWED